MKSEELFDGMDDTYQSYENDNFIYPAEITEKMIKCENEILKKYGFLPNEDEPEDAHIGYELGDKARMEYINEKLITVVCPKCCNAPEYKLRQDGWNEISCECGFVWNESKF